MLPKLNIMARVLIILSVLFVGGVPVIFAELERVGPTNPANGYPAWYQDKTGLTIEFCNPLNQSELNGGWCLILPADVPSGTAPETFPNNFADEHFYWAADTGISFDLPGGGSSRAILVLGLEAAFAVGPVIQNDQVVFGRNRINIRNLPYNGTYKVYHPYGVWTFTDQVAGERLFFTEDLGINCPAGQFDCALVSHVGPFLLPSTEPGGLEMPPVDASTPGLVTPYPGTGKKYIADPGRIGPVTGGSCTPTVPIPLTPQPGDCITGNLPTDPLGTPARPLYVTTDGLRNPNIFRVEGPNGFVIETSDFVLMGRLFTGTIPGRVSVDRASYTNTATTQKVDVFATGFTTSQPRLPAGLKPASVMPVIAFYNAPCTPTLDANGNPGPPFSAPAGVSDVQMFNTGNIFWGQVQQLPTGDPPAVCVVDETSRDANGQVVPTFLEKNVTDQVAITEALWDPQNGGSLSVKATSSDSAATLRLAGFGATPETLLTNGQVVVAPVPIPPAKVFVNSIAGGQNEFQVTTGIGNASGGNIPVAMNDEVQPILEDSGTTTINVLANDTYNGTPVVTITGAPRLGTAVVNNGMIDYTPFLNANGSEGIGYTVSVNGYTSSQAYVTIPIAPVNDPPVAVNDATSAVASFANTINVLANDADPDGAADLVAAVNATPAAGLTINSVTGGNVNFTASAGGTYTFTYQARDQAGLTSANTATVTVTVAGSETITVVASEFRSKALRWKVDGTDNVRGGQTLTLTYVDGIYRVNGSCPSASNAVGTEIGTAVVDPAGAWALDKIVSASGILNPSNSGNIGGNFWCTPPRTIRITSQLTNATITRSIAFK